MPGNPSRKSTLDTRTRLQTHSQPVAEEAGEGGGGKEVSGELVVKVTTRRERARPERRLCRRRFPV